MKGKLFVLSFIICMLPLTSGFINCSNFNDELNIYYYNTLLFPHSSASPLFSIGVGEASFQNTAGNFIIDDNITEEVALTEFQITVNESERCSVTFTNQLNVVKVSFNLQEITAPDNKTVLNFEANVEEDTERKYNRLFMNVFSTASEKLYGAGEQYTYFNLKGYKFPIWTSEQGLGRDNGVIANASDLDGGVGGSYYTTYWPQASYFSNRGYAMMISNYEYLELNFEAEDNILVYIHSTAVAGNVLAESEVGSLIPRISGLIGRQPVLPDWIMKGAILGLENGTQEVMDRYNEAKAADVDISGLWIQDWSGYVNTGFGYRVYWNWQYNDTLYPDFEQMIVDLNQDGVQVLAYCNPHLIEGSAMFSDAERLGYLLQNSSGQTYLFDFGGFLGGTVDLLSNEAKLWYSDTLRANMIDIGIRGWMADFGEYTDMEMISSNLSYSAEAQHNYFPVAWAEANKEITVNYDDAVYFMRSGGLGSSALQRLAWAGDQNVDFSVADGVASTVVAALSLAVSGMGVTHFDIGGYTTIPPLLKRSRQLLLRSAEYAVFTPVMRTHVGNKPEANVQIFDSEVTLLEFARLTQIHSMLFNYTKDIVTQNSVNGVPVQRPMFYHYELDAEAWNVRYQYMYGPDVIVAPVINEDEYEVTVYIPGGDGATWIPLWSEGGEADYQTGPKNVTLPAPIGFPAVLYRMESSYKTLFEKINAKFGGSAP